MNIPIRMSPHDKGFATGLKTAAQIARKSATDMLRFGVGAKYRSARAALEQLADDLDTLATPAGETPRPAQAAADHLRGPVFAEASAAEGMSVLPARAKEAVAKGYTGDECRDCGNFTLIRNGTCLKCDTCGSTTGCS